MQVNKYPSTCAVCGETVLAGEGEVYSSPTKTQDGIFQSNWVVKHIKRCAPVKVLILVKDGVLTVEVDRKAVAILYDQDTKEKRFLTTEYMNGGHQLSFDLFTDELKGEK